jgi:hypothetical protein
MLVACRLAGLSALETHYAGVNALAQFGPTQSPNAPPGTTSLSRPGERRACDISSAARAKNPAFVLGAGPHGQRRRRPHVATFCFGKVQPSSPSACRAAASRSVRHSA